MFNPEKLLGKIVGEVVSTNGSWGKKGKKKGSGSLLGGLASGGGLMTLIGLGVGAYEILKQQGQQAQAGGMPPPAPPGAGTTGGPPPPPPPAAAAPPPPQGRGTAQEKTTEFSVCTISYLYPEQLFDAAKLPGARYESVTAALQKIEMSTGNEADGKKCGNPPRVRYLCRHRDALYPLHNRQPARRRLPPQLLRRTPHRGILPGMR